MEKRSNGEGLVTILTCVLRGIDCQAAPDSESRKGCFGESKCAEARRSAVSVILGAKSLTSPSTVLNRPLSVYRFHE